MISAGQISCHLQPTRLFTSLRASIASLPKSGMCRSGTTYHCLVTCISSTFEVGSNCPATGNMFWSGPRRIFFAGCGIPSIMELLRVADITVTSAPVSSLNLIGLPLIRIVAVHGSDLSSCIAPRNKSSPVVTSPTVLDLQTA